MEVNTGQAKKEIHQIPGHLSLNEATNELVRYAELVRDSATEREILKDPYLALQFLEIRRKGMQALFTIIQQYVEQPIKG